MGNEGTVRLVDIAEHAGVSVATVSRAMRRDLPPGSRVGKQVRQIASELGYKTIRKRERSLGRVVLLTRGISLSDRGRYADSFPNGSQFFGRFALGIEKAVRSKNGSLVLQGIDRNTDLGEAISKAVRDSSANGVICLGGFKNADLSFDASGLPPVVLVNKASGEASADAVVSDDAGGVEQVVRRLVKQGHERIAFCFDRNSGEHHNYRLNGYYRAIENLGLGYKKVFYDEVSEKPYEQRMEDVFQEFLNETLRPTAIVCVADNFAFSLLRLAKTYGIKVPDQLSLVGFNNVDAAIHSEPSLSSVEMNLEEMGVEAVNMLLERLQNPERSYRQIMLQAKFIERESSGFLKA